MSFQTFLFKMMCKRSDDKRDRGLTPPDTITLHEDISYGPHGKWNLLDVYLPKEKKDRLPVIVNFHGGGWVYGTKETYRYYCMSLAEQGFAVVNPSYRLAPKNRYPAAFEDMNKVFGFVMSKAEEYSFDPDRIFGIGDSAGATGMAAFAAVLTNEELRERLGVVFPKGLRIRGLGLNCGMFTTKSKEMAFVHTLPKENKERALSVLDVVFNITGDFPPCYLMTAVNDFMNDEQQVMVDALTKAGVRYEYKVYGDENNSLGHVFHCDVRSESGRQANREELDFLRSCV